MADSDEYQKNYRAAQANIEAHEQFRLFGIKGYEQSPARNGISYSCEIIFKGRRVGDARDEGRGGMVFVRIHNEEAKAAWDELCRAIGPAFKEPDGVVVDALLCAAGV